MLRVVLPLGCFVVNWFLRLIRSKDQFAPRIRILDDILVDRFSRHVLEVAWFAHIVRMLGREMGQTADSNSDLRFDRRSIAGGGGPLFDYTLGKHC